MCRGTSMFVLFMSLFAITSTQRAPGDEDDICLTLLGRPSVVNQEILMASYNYQNLLESEGGPWVVLNEDNNNDGRNGLSSQTTWTQSGASCSRVTSVCGFSFGPQNNWMITQFINNTLRREDVYIRVTFALNSQCTTGCQTTVDMYVLQTDEVDQNFVRNVSVFESACIFVLTSSIRDGSILITRTFRISADLSTSGLYVAFRDLGTCVGISEVVVYYPVCDSISLLDVGANFSRQFPEGTSVGSCFANMAFDQHTTSDQLTATCTLNITRDDTLTVVDVSADWAIDDGPSSGCMCLPGYSFTSRTTIDQCEACPPFTFKSTLSNTDVCQPCPLFSNTTDSDTAVAVCPCDPGYYRTESEDATLPCTRPPSAPRHLSASNITSTRVFLQWESPLDDGNRIDVFYTISENVSNTSYNTTDTSFFLDNLMPFTHYEIRITADNGVSSQDDAVDDRTVSVQIMTDQTRPPSAPLNLTASDITNTTVLLQWNNAFYEGDYRDLFYIISDNVSNSSYTRNNTRLLLENLIPFVHYEIRVTAEVVVPTQDSTVDERTISVQIMTMEGIPPQVNSIRVNGNGIIQWSPFTFPHGIILYYEVAATRQFSDNEIYNFNVTGFTIDLSTRLTHNETYSVKKALHVTSVG